ncbi:hypothetical protein LY76DRAFT_86969 [Colletotrichum caudatum]|nr:hypothetical protein LY76DRAFT_86969 [Colletotrichum caudatum]
MHRPAAALGAPGVKRARTGRDARQTRSRCHLCREPRTVPGFPRLYAMTSCHIYGSESTFSFLRHLATMMMMVVFIRKPGRVGGLGRTWAFPPPSGSRLRHLRVIGLFSGLAPVPNTTHVREAEEAPTLPLPFAHRISR